MTHNFIYLSSMILLIMIRLFYSSIFDYDYLYNINFSFFCRKKHL